MTVTYTSSVYPYNWTQNNMDLWTIWAEIVKMLYLRIRQLRPLKEKNTFAVSFKELECRNLTIKFWPKSNAFYIIPDGLWNLICIKRNLVTLKSWGFLGGFSKWNSLLLLWGSTFFKVVKLKSFPWKSIYPFLPIN